jgi:signal transduction histidine kinase
MRSWLDDLQESRSQLNAIISAVPVGLIVFKLDEEITLLNAAGERLLNCAGIETAMASLISLAYLPEKRAYRYAEAEQTFQADLLHYIAALRHPLHLIPFDSNEAVYFGLTTVNGKTLSLKGSKTTWKGESAVVILVTDVTVMLQLEQAQAVSQYQNLMLRSVSHELRTPTNGIMHTVSQAIEAEEVPWWVKEKLKVAEVCSKQLLILIDDLLDYSQVIIGRFRLTKATFVLRDTVTNAFEMPKQLAKQKHIQMVMSIDPLLPDTAYSDSKRLSQVLVNLLSCAIKFTQSGGRIRLFAFLNGAGFMEISVTDNGMGIPAEYLDIFNVQGRSSANSALNPQGTGLGLHIANILGNMLGGQNIQCVSSPGRGSTFTFLVDIYETDRFATVQIESSSDDFIEQEDEAKLDFEVPMFCSHMKDLPQILVVDDTPFNRMVVIDFLKTIGLQCLEVESGKDCIDLVISRAATELPIKLIIMDFEMPEMDGPTAARLLIQMLRSQRLPVPKIVAHTAYVSDIDQMICRDAGMIDFIPKPTSKANFLKIVQDHLR